MTLMTKFLGAAAGLALTSGAALAEPALIFDLGGKFDKSFNEAAFNGATRWAEETGGKFAEIEMQSEAQCEQALRRFAESGANPIITMGFAMADALSTAGCMMDADALHRAATALGGVRRITLVTHEGDLRSLSV